ncbi:MAG: dihydroxyacetone kinase subunit L [Hyphomicrobiaceae bacterium]|nr:dihydroxyacetone kinase subunit L [Hyphomicrobiaceae bacterium]
MTDVTIREISAIVERARLAFDAAESDLNAADGRFGDGDTGTMLNRLASAIALVDLKAEPDLGSAFRKMAAAASRSTGSSLGTLVMTALLAVSKYAAGQSTLSRQAIPEMIEAAATAMLARGGASLGDKTIVDSIATVAGELKTAPAVASWEVASAASRKALDSFRDRPSRIGRAGRYGNKTIGFDDPGMLAFAILCGALARSNVGLRPEEVSE